MIKKLLSIFFVAALAFSLKSCAYRFRDVSLDPRVKTVKVTYFDNRARRINPQLSPKLTEQVLQKITNYTKLTRTNNDDAHYIISGTITGYNTSTVSISSQSSTNAQAVTNRLNVTVHVIFTNTIENKTQEFDFSRDFDFDASLSLDQAESTLTDRIVKNISDEIFNRIFSNW
jgi:hypothetical protein